MLSPQIKTHLALAPDIDNICQPLKQHFDVVSMVYHKNFNDGSEIRLSNQPAWIEHYYSQNLFKISGFEKHPQHYQSGHVVWNYLTHHQPILAAACKFNIAHGFTRIKKAADGCEFYFFGTQVNNSHLLNTYLNNLDLFEQFTLYFKEKANSLLTQLSQQKIIIPNKYRQNHSLEQGIPHPANNQQQAFLRDIKINTIYVQPDVRLSNRELGCARLIMQGKTAREIAALLFISPRTVETHINHLKDKLNCSNKSALIEKLLLLNIDKIDFKKE